MSSKLVISDTLEYYDTNKEKYTPLINKIKYIKFIDIESELSRNKVNLYDENDKLMNSYEYEIIGLFDNNTNIWVWSWGIPTVKKNQTGILRKIFNYGIDLDSDEYLRNELITSRFKISNEIQIDMHLSIVSFLSKQPLIIKYYLLKDAKEFYDKHNKNQFLHDDEIDYSNVYGTYYLFLLDADK